MTTLPDVLSALRGLGPGAHGTREVWWALVGAGWADATETRTVRLGDVERALDEAWEAEAVERYDPRALADAKARQAEWTSGEVWR